MKTKDYKAEHRIGYAMVNRLAFVPEDNEALNAIIDRRMTVMRGRFDAGLIQKFNRFRAMWPPFEVLKAIVELEQKRFELDMGGFMAYLKELYSVGS